MIKELVIGFVVFALNGRSADRGFFVVVNSRFLSLRYFTADHLLVPIYFGYLFTIK